MPDKTVLVINLGWEQEPLVNEVLSQGYRVVGVHLDDSYNPELGLDHVEIIPFRDIEAILAVAEKLKPAAVVADQCGYSYFATAVVSEKLGLPGPRVGEAQVATNKALQRQKASQCGVLQPRHQLCTTLEGAREFVASIGFPVVLKPVDNRGSFGVNRVDKEDDLADAFFDALVNAHSRMILVEEFIHGCHITIDGYCFPRVGHKSLALATKKMIGGARQVAIDIIYPGELPPEIFDQAVRNNDEVISKLGFRFGMTHAEYMIDGSGDYYLIEIANRGGGCYTSAKIVPAVSGIDVTQQLVFDSTGAERDLFYEKSSHESGAAYLKFFVFEPGRINSVFGVDEAREMSGVEALRLLVGEGDEVLRTTTDADRHGFVITTGETREDARSVAQRVTDMLKVVYY